MFNSIIVYNHSFKLFLGGHFVCKVFDMFTPFSVGLFYLLYRCFERVCLFKPVTSRPANSERYFIINLLSYIHFTCMNLRSNRGEASMLELW